NHWYELIDDYKPLIIWNDIGYPPGTKINEIFAYYYNKIPNGVINDRWLQIPKWLRKLLQLYIPRKILTWASKRAFLKGSASMPTNYHHDFKTPEYGVFKKISKKKWECTRGIGNSFGYNQFENEEDYLSLEQLIYIFVDLVSKNGNLLLNVGPKADGTIPKTQKKILLEFGKWLEINGDAIYGTRPWKRAEGITLNNEEIRYTQKENFLYAILLGKPMKNYIIIRSLRLRENPKIELLGYGNCAYEQIRKDFKIILPKNIKYSPAYSFKISPKPKK
ncbi:MAG: alpha-L-fucosidase, partial [Promethearchaeota archaeon]